MDSTSLSHPLQSDEEGTAKVIKLQDLDPPEIVKQLIYTLLASEPLWRQLPGAGPIYGEAFLESVLDEVWGYGSENLE